MPETADATLADGHELVRYPDRRPPKWSAGDPLVSLDELDAAASEGVMLWHRNKPAHARWIYNLSYGYLRAALRHGWIREAVISPLFRQWLGRELAALPKDD